ncbi:threonine synthase [Limibacillus halophilus]|uniref:Threonine synthase n=1 Tax=Limibacillus halophilus TaxID=1579333 RepID=A0A839SV74_9PROT|nr:threonine synthase [Limibacillus halophilus]MBB3066707.1 threonine synthase [Limibacillus halophilus]
MRYISTRGTAPTLEFDDVLLSGLARDGGLYIPESWPTFSQEDLVRMSGMSYCDLAVEIIAPFMTGSAALNKLPQLIEAAYAGFGHPAVTPLRQLEGNLWLLELFHGPTLAFKDVALQLLGQLFEVVLEARDQRVTIVGATSGDTGSAAIEAVMGKARATLYMLHPKGRVSEVQRRQMTTVDAANIHNLAVAGTFDDCQDLVKAMFNDQAFRDRHNLAAVNSINWARVMAQIVYYFWAGLALGAPHRPVAFAVPTGNFGNVYAGYAARQMGLPIERLVVGSNHNDILTRFLDSGTMAMEGVSPSYSPSMDIQVSSNFERLLFDLLGRDGAAVTATMRQFREEGRFTLDPASLAQATALFQGVRFDDEETLAEIARRHTRDGELTDPHSAIAIAAARSTAKGSVCPLVALATAHPAKFPDAVEKATGLRPALPTRLADLLDRPEYALDVPADLAHLEGLIDDGDKVAQQGAPTI